MERPKKSDIWDKEFGDIKLPPKEEIKRQLERYGIIDGTDLRLYLGRYATAEDLEKKRAEVFGKPPYDLIPEKSQ